LLINKNNNLATNFLRRRLASFALLPIALLQLTLAVHQFDHVAEYVGDSCHVCVQLDRVDAAADHWADSAPPRLVDIPRLQAPSVSVSRQVLRNFDSRAPPGL
jgi:hypothetical protein